MMGSLCGIQKQFGGRDIKQHTELIEYRQQPEPFSLLSEHFSEL